MLKFGIVLESKPGFVKVVFEQDDNLVSDWFPVLFTRTLNDKFEGTPEKKEHVACIVDEHCENGVCLGCICSTEDLPGINNLNVLGVKFSNDDEISYNKETRTHKIKVGENQITVKAAGPAIKSETESLKTILLDALHQMSIASNSGGVLANAAAFTAIKERVNAFFES